MARRQDFLDEIVSDRTAKNRNFPALVDAALERRRLLRALAEERELQGITQTDVAAGMRTSQSAVARIESGQADVKLSTVERYAAAVGKRVEWQLVDA
jgi:ribosome-binding protein aMBF1 (putative translation factor)